MSIKRDIIKVYDMTCTSCENRVEKALKKIDGVTNAIASNSVQLELQAVHRKLQVYMVMT